MTYAITRRHLPEDKHDEVDHHQRVDPHQSRSILADVILGGQDGLVNVLGIVLGIAAATNHPRLVLVAGLAATVAESISMAAVAYTSTLAETAHYESEREREYRHVQEVPAVEQQEIREIYRQKGFEGEILEQIVDKITEDEDIWVKVMMAEEHQLSPTGRQDAFKSAVIVGAAAVVGSLIPLIPFLFLTVTASIWVSLGISAATLFAVGVYKARATVGHAGKSGFEMAAIGTISALAGYLVGLLLKVTPE